MSSKNLNHLCPYGYLKGKRGVVDDGIVKLGNRKQVLAKSMSMPYWELLRVRFSDAIEQRKWIEYYSEWLGKHHKHMERLALDQEERSLMAVIAEADGCLRLVEHARTW